MVSASILVISILPVILSVLYFHFGFQKSYVVHRSGIIVISGASTGIGRHAAEYLAREKGFVVYAGVRKQEDINSILDSKIPSLRPLLLDVTSHISCEEAAKTVLSSSRKENLPIIALVNNAGIARKVPLEFHDIDDAKSVFNTNFFGMMDLTQALLPFLRESKGRVVMISSIAGKIGTPLGGVYSASKFAMEAFSDSLRRELASFDVSVSVVEPGYVKTPIFERIKESSRSTGYKAGTFAEGGLIYHKFDEEPYMSREANDIKQASNVTVTTDAIVDAIVNPTPFTRYVVAGGGGFPGWLVVFIVWLFPDRAIDGIFFS